MSKMLNIMQIIKQRKCYKTLKSVEDDRICILGANTLLTATIRVPLRKSQEDQAALGWPRLWLYRAAVSVCEPL